MNPSSSQTRPTFQSIARRVFNQEIRAIECTRNLIHENFDQACELLMKCEGRVILTGMGKSGHIARKIAATFSSTGTPAFFVHPAEAQHGDLGMITEKDIVVAISYSGSTSEILALIPHLTRFKIPLIAITKKEDSSLGRYADTVILIDIEDKEACPLNLAPTSSTTATLVLGDALAIALLESKGFKESDFATFHPAGNLGKKSLLKVDELMHKGKNLPLISPKASVEEAILEITRKRLGMTTVCTDEHHLLGIFTDGDLRRTFEKNTNIQTTSVEHIMSTHPKTMHSEELAIKAAQIMQEFKITAIPVLDSEEKVVGVIHLHDLLGNGVI
jgi:arabinose-5-phosphate isomerase